jgi:O-antigen/teichoic acid export membrane protein
MNVSVATLVLWATVSWRPTLSFSFERLWGLVSFGWKLLAAGLIDVTYNNIRQLLIGKLYTESDLAFFSRGQQLPMLVVVNVNTSLDSVLLPVMSQKQDDVDGLRSMCRKSMSVNTYVIAPLMMGMAFCAEPLISLVFTDKWLPAVPYLQIFCLTYVFSPLQTITVDAVKALGKSGLYLRLEIAKKAIGMTLLLITMRMGVLAMAWSLFASYLATQAINMWASRRILGYRYREQLIDILPSIALAIGMGCVVRSLALLGMPTIVTLALQFFLGAGIYLGMSRLLRLEAFENLKQMVTSFLSKVRAS